MVYARLKDQRAISGKISILSPTKVIFIHNGDVIRATPKTADIVDTSGSVLNDWGEYIADFKKPNWPRYTKPMKVMVVNM